MRFFEEAVNAMRRTEDALDKYDAASYNAMHELDWEDLMTLQELCQRVANKIEALEARSFVAAAKVLPEEPTELTQGVSKVVAAASC